MVNVGLGIRRCGFDSRRLWNFFNLTWPNLIEFGAYKRFLKPSSNSRTSGRFLFDNLPARGPAEEGYRPQPGYAGANPAGFTIYLL